MDTLLAILSLSPPKTATSMMETCRFLYHEGAKVILQQPVHLSRPENEILALLRIIPGVPSHPNVHACFPCDTPHLPPARRRLILVPELHDEGQHVRQHPVVVPCEQERRPNVAGDSLYKVVDGLQLLLALSIRHPSHRLRDAGA